MLSRVGVRAAVLLLPTITILLALHQIPIRARDPLDIRHLVDDAAGVEPVERDHHQRHQQRVKDVDVDLLGLQHAVLAHDVLGHAEDGSHQDGETGGVEHVEELLPGRDEFVGLLGRLAADAHVEDEGDDHEKAKEDDLDS